MATWTLKTLHKKSAVEKQFWYKDGKTIIREEGYRWGEFYCESDYDWELSSLDDGCWADWTFPDDMTEEEQAAIETAWDEDYFDGMEELGWSNSDTDYILQGPLELTDEEGNVVYEGKDE